MEGLEETELFRRFASLLKLQNCMIMSLLKRDQNLMGRFRQACRAE